MQGVGIIQRAFEVAEVSGSVDEVRQRLTREGYVQVEAHLSGPKIRRDLSSRLDPALRAARTRER